MNKASGAEIGRIPVDSIYSPVLKVTYKVEATRVEQRTDFDKLILDVETKNSISPRDALASAGKTLVEVAEFIKHELQENSGRSQKDYAIRNDRRVEYLFEVQGIEMPDDLKSPPPDGTHH
jgi:DNA-directed RNA polymerase alpha subunit